MITHNIIPHGNGLHNFAITNTQITNEQRYSLIMAIIPKGSTKSVTLKVLTRQKRPMENVIFTNNYDTELIYYVLTDVNLYVSIFIIFCFFSSLHVWYKLLNIYMISNAYTYQVCLHNRY